MTLVESAGGTGTWPTNSGTVTTGTITPASGDLLAAIAVCGNGANSASTAIAMSGTGAMSGAWTLLAHLYQTTGAMAAVFVKDAGASPSPGTATATFSSPSEGSGLIVRRFAGARPAASQTGVTVTAGTPGGGILTIATGTGLTTGSQVVGGFADSTGSIALTANGSTTLYNQSNGSAGDTEAAFEASALSTAGVSVTLGFTNSPASQSTSIVLVEILPASTAASGPASIQPGPTWFDTFKPGMRRPRPFIVSSTALSQGPLAVTLPGPVTSLTGTDVNPASLPAIVPGPTWFDTFKPGMRRPRPPVPPSFAFSGEAGPLNVTLPAFTVSLTGIVNLPLDVPRIQPGPTWLDLFKPGMPRPRPPAPPVAVKTESGPLSVLLLPPATLLSSTVLITGPFSIILPALVTNLLSRDIRSPENMGAVLSLPSPNGVTTEVTEGATCILPSYGGTLALVTLSATTVGWTMQTAPLNLLEFNDVTIDIAITQNGSPYNLSGVTVNMLFKSAAGTPDASALLFSSAGGSPAITITSTAGGLAVAQIPNADLDNEVYFFYRIDVVSGGFTNTCLSGPITWTSL